MNSIVGGVAGNDEEEDERDWTHTKIIMIRLYLGFQKSVRGFKKKKLIRI